MEEQFTKASLDKKLTEKEKMFCHQYIVDWNATRAAKAAGYSAASATDTAAKLKNKPYIKQYIDYIKDDIAAEARISKLRIIKELKHIAFSDLTKLFDDWMSLRDFDDLQLQHPDIMSAVQEISTRKTKFGDEVRVKLYDKRGALQDLLKAMGWNEPDKLKVGLGDQIRGITFVDEEHDLH